MKNQQGFSLVELLIVMALLASVLAVGFTTYGVSHRGFEGAKQRSQLQVEIAELARYLSNELRNVANDHLMILNAANLSFEPGFQYIYFDESEQTVYHYRDKKISLSSSVIQVLDFQLTKKPEGVVLTFQIKGSDSKNEFKIKSSVLLNNVTELTELIPADGRTAIRYKKPD